MNLRIVHEAEIEANEAACWYEIRKAGLGERFFTAVQEMMRQIAEAPFRFARVETVRVADTVRHAAVQQSANDPGHNRRRRNVGAGARIADDRRGLGCGASMLTGAVGGLVEGQWLLSNRQVRNVSALALAATLLILVDVAFVLRLLRAD